MELKVIDTQGKSSGKVAVNDSIFSVPANEHVVQSAVVWYLASQRRGTHSAKTRSDVSGGGKKPWKQKGTGRARAGSSRSPLWRGGGVVFPPKPRDYSYALPKKVRKLALKVVLSDKARGDRIKVLPEIKMESPKTKGFLALIKSIDVSGKMLFVLDEADKNIELSSRNIQGLKLVRSSALNIHDLLNSDWIVTTKGTLKNLEEGLK